MFLKSRRKSATAVSGARAGGSAGSLIGPDMTVVGDLRAAGEIRIEGEIGGDVFGQSVSVGEGGVVRGSVFAETVHIAGAVEGRIEAVSVSVARSARVAGSITHNELEIESGAHIKGRRPWRPLSYLEQNRHW